MYRDIAAAVYRRAVEGETGNYEIPSWAWALLFVDFLVFLPVWFYVSYSVANIYPVLAIIEDPSPPAYEPVSLNEDGDSFAEDSPALAADEAARGIAAPPVAISSSIRGLDRAIRGINGVWSNFRGLSCYIALSFATLFVYGIVSAVPFVPSIVAAVISAVTLVQLYTTWTHMVISLPRAERVNFWRRMPSFTKTFRATALPTVLYLLMAYIGNTVPALVSGVLGMPSYDPKQPNVMPNVGPSTIWKALVVIAVAVGLNIFIVIPAHVVLTRVQASMLPEEDETVVPFDRSFQGTVEPAVVGGKGYVTMLDAWKTFSRASWIRLVKLYVKILGITMLVSFLFLAVVVPEGLLILKYSKKIDQ